MSNRFSEGFSKAKFSSYALVAPTVCSCGGVVGASAMEKLPADKTAAVDANGSEVKTPVDKLFDEFGTEYDIAVEEQYDLIDRSLEVISNSGSDKNKIDSYKNRCKLGFVIITGDGKRVKKVTENSEVKGDLLGYVSQVKNKMESLNSKQSSLAKIFQKVLNDFARECVKGRDWSEFCFLSSIRGPIVGCWNMRLYLERLYNLCDMFESILENKEYVPTVGNFTKKEIMYLRSLGYTCREYTPNNESLEGSEGYEEYLEAAHKYGDFPMTTLYFLAKFGCKTNSTNSEEFSNIYNKLLEFKKCLLEMRSITAEKRTKLMEEFTRSSFNAMFKRNIFGVASDDELMGKLFEEYVLDKLRKSYEIIASPSATNPNGMRFPGFPGDLVYGIERYFYGDSYPYKEENYEGVKGTELRLLSSPAANVTFQS